MAGVPFTCQASTDHWDSADRTEPMLAAEPTESTDAIEPADPIDKIDPAEPMDRIDPADPMDRIDPLDPMLKMELSVFRMRLFSQARLPSGPLVAISGIGGLGHLALQYAKIFGAMVAAVDITDEKLKLAGELGADIVIDARDEDSTGPRSSGRSSAPAPTWPRCSPCTRPAGPG
jgi:hypothetical protein